MFNKDLLKAPFNGEEYNFLVDIPFLNNNIFYLTVGGSRSYGTNTPESDYDLRGAFIETPRNLISLEKPIEEYIETETDSCIYSLNKWVRLLASCNPNVIEMLGSREEDIVYINEIGKLLRENYQLFLSQRAYYTFSGYATQQLRRLQNALARDEYSQPDKERHIKKTIEMDILAAGKPFNMYLLAREEMDNSESKFDISLDVRPSKNEEFEEEIFINGNMVNLPLRDFLKLNSQMQNTIKNYGKLTQRNKKKDALHLNKHAMHLIRLYYMGIDILKNGEIVTYREKEHDLLMSIRNGGLPYEKIFEMQKELEAKMETARIETKLPEKVDMDKINDLLMEIYSEVYKMEV